MPDPSNYSDKNKWMAACVPVLIDEGREQDQAVAICSSMWDKKYEEIFVGSIFKTRRDVVKLVNPQKVVITKKTRLIRDD